MCVDMHDIRRQLQRPRKQRTKREVETLVLEGIDRALNNCIVLV